jgi:NDP-sugar pyrophosphorylase family protein
MKAMIFAAGLGTRLKPFTEQHPKALVPVNGIPMLQRVLMNIADAGITDIVVNVHHFAEQIVDFLSANKNFGLNISISDESKLLLDTGGGLLKARNLLLNSDATANSQSQPKASLNIESNEPILLHNADILTDVPIREMLQQHQQSNADVTLLCAHRESSRTLYFDEATNRLAGWQNLKTGEQKPAGFCPTAQTDASPFGGVHIVSASSFPLLQAFNAEQLANGNHSANEAQDRSAEHPVVPFSIVPFYLANIAKLNIQRYLLPENCQWFDVGSTNKLLQAEQSFHNFA